MIGVLFPSPSPSRRHILFPTFSDLLLGGKRYLFSLHRTSSLKKKNSKKKSNQSLNRAEKGPQQKEYSMSKRNRSEDGLGFSPDNYPKRNPSLSSGSLHASITSPTRPEPQHNSFAISPSSTEGNSKQQQPQQENSSLTMSQTAEDAENVNNAAFLDRYSRQIGTYGMETMAKLVSLKVLIVGCDGLGVEAAKNLALAGVHSISLLDSTTPRPEDLGVNFAIGESDVGGAVSRGELVRRLVVELNPTVRTKVVAELTEEIVRQHSVVVVTSGASNLSKAHLVHWDDFCRKNGVSFILALQVGPAGSVFVDHGDSFVIRDVDGRAALQKQIDEVVHKVDKSGRSYSRVRFTTPEGMTPGALRDYTRVKFTDVKGLVNEETGESINEKMFDAFCGVNDPKGTIRIYPSFEEQGFSAYVTGGFLHEQKEEINLSFRPLSEALVSPGEFVQVSAMMDNVMESHVHVLLNALVEFAEGHGGALPTLHDAAQAEELVLKAQEYLARNAAMPSSASAVAEVEEEEKPSDPERPTKPPAPPKPTPLQFDGLDANFIRTCALLARAQLQPYCAFFGAVVAQEIVKITGKYTPVNQWFHLHCVEALPEEAQYATNEDFRPIGCRYDHVIAMFGKAFQERLGNLKLFMVGCGALGCENIKNFALCGISCGPQGSLVVTDNDRIEISNLSRQFLFREDNVGQPKSLAAGARMKLMNKDAKVDSRQDFVGPATQKLFPDRFWMNLDGVVNALDNIEARLYVDKQCVLFQKVLVEAGTMGTGGNVDIIVPGKTTSYADGGAADETGGIPMCTLRNFPYIFDHCIEWARAQFDDLFVSPLQQTQQLLEDPAAFIAKLRNEVTKAESAGQRRTLIEKHTKSLKNLCATMSVMAANPTVQACAQMAWQTMHQLFRDRILDLQLSFPKDAKKSNGDPFWSGHRTFPTSIDGSEENLKAIPDTFEFLVAATNLYATMFGLYPEKPAPRFNDPKNRWMAAHRTSEFIRSSLAGTPIPTFQRSAVDGLDDESAGALASGEAPTDESLLQAFNDLLLQAEQSAASVKSSKAQPLDFEKDDDDNFHIDFITAAANLRATNYNITRQDRMKVKMVAGRIIPAIATTTSAVTGLALVEFFKVLQNKDVSALRNGMIDVGSNYYVLFDRDPPIKKRSTVEKTYMPENDYTYRKKIIRVPEGFTKYDRFEVDVTPATTMTEFADALAALVNKTLPADHEAEYEVAAVGVGAGSLWNGSKKHSNANRPLLSVIEEQKAREAGVAADGSFWSSREIFADLEVMLNIDVEEDVDDVEVETAPVILRIRRE